MARYTAQERRDMVEDCLASDLTTKEWCQTHGILEATMSRWMSAMGMGQEEGGDAAPAFVEVDLARLPADGAAPAMVVELGGARVTVPHGADERDVRMLLRAVSSL